MDPRSERIREWMDGTRHLAPITELLGITPVEVGRGDVTLAMEAGTRFHSPLGRVHGGIIVDLADAAMGTATAMVLDDGDSFVTTDLHVAYLKSVRDGRVTARAVVIKEGRTTIYLEAEVRQGDSLIARLSSTCVVQRSRGPVNAATS